MGLWSYSTFPVKSWIFPYNYHYYLWTLRMFSALRWRSAATPQWLASTAMATARPAPMIMESTWCAHRWPHSSSNSRNPMETISQSQPPSMDSQDCRPEISGVSVRCDGWKLIRLDLRRRSISRPLTKNFLSLLASMSFRSMRLHILIDR